MTGLRRSVRAELAKLSWRSPVLYALVPLAVVIPVLINGAIAAAAERDVINGRGGMDTDNAAYWVIVFSTFILMAGAVTSYCGEFGDHTAPMAFQIAPARWRLPVAKLIVFGALASLTVFATTLINLAVLPKVFPEVWDRVDPLDSDGIHLLVGTPVLAVLIVVLALGIAMLIPRPGVVIMVLLLWRWGVEVCVGFIRGDLGTALQRYSLFKNGEIGAGQSPTFDSPFGGPVGAMAYFGCVALIVFAVGLYRLHATDVRDD